MSKLPLINCTERINTVTRGPDIVVWVYENVRQTEKVMGFDNYMFDAVSVIDGVEQKVMGFVGNPAVIPRDGDYRVTLGYDGWPVTVPRDGN